jgi:hypothetical protein
MFTSIVQCQAKKGKTEELARKVRNEVLHTLQNRPGFIDFVACDFPPRRFLVEKLPTRRSGLALRAP